MGDNRRSHFRRERSPVARDPPWRRFDSDAKHAPTDRYIPNSRPERPRRHPRSPSPAFRQVPPPRQYDPRPEGYVFKGAAADRDNDRSRQPPPQFSFQAPGPQFPSRESLPDRSWNPRGAENGPREYNREKRDARRGGMARGRQRGGFGPRPAHTRDILHTRRASTPEQLAGMNGEARATITVSDTSDEDATGTDNVVDLTQDSDEDDDAPRKRVKSEPERPQTKWSNPDPYTSLPPTETSNGPKKDIVKMIRKDNRKGKLDSTDKNDSQSAASNGLDFISLDEMLSEEGEASDSDAREQEILASIASLSNPPNGTKGTKRKRGEQATDQGEILQEWRATGTNPSPWYKIDHSRTADLLLRLHKEICDFNAFVRPSNAEADARHNLVDRVNRALQSHTPYSTVRGKNGKHARPNGESVVVNSFGSYASRLYLPTADMDLVATSGRFTKTNRPDIYQSNNLKRDLGDYLVQVGIAMRGSLTIIGKAKVPLIKFVDQRTNVKVDISFENNTGLVANDTLRRWKERYPAMPPLVLLIKQLLLMRGLNEVFNGGLGGFSIICLVVSMLHHMPQIQSGEMIQEHHLGELFIEFLDLYGNKFDFRRTGIAMKGTPRLFDKVRSPAAKQNLNRLTIMDPNNDLNDVSGGSSNIGAVFETFRRAHGAVVRRMEEVRSAKRVEGSLLECIIGGDYSSYGHRRMNWDGYSS